MEIIKLLRKELFSSLKYRTIFTEYVKPLKYFVAKSILSIMQ